MQQPLIMQGWNEDNMENKNHNFLTANSVKHILDLLKNVQDLQIIGGCTGNDPVREHCATIRHIPELKITEKHERYIDFGPAVTISDMLSLGRSNMPTILYEALETIGCYQIRNIATLGGNICSKGLKQTLWAPLLALDARLEIKSETSTKYIPFTKFEGIPEKYILTRIRVPIDEWQIAQFKRIGPSARITEESAGFVFLVNTQKNMIVDIKIAFAGNGVFKSSELENKIIGARIPLDKKFIEDLITEADIIFSARFNTPLVNPILKAQFLNLLKYSLEQLA